VNSVCVNGVFLGNVGTVRGGIVQNFLCGVSDYIAVCRISFQVVAIPHSAHSRVMGGATTPACNNHLIPQARSDLLQIGDQIKVDIIKSASAFTGKFFPLEIGGDTRKNVTICWERVPNFLTAVFQG